MDSQRQSKQPAMLPSPEDLPRHRFAASPPRNIALRKPFTSVSKSHSINRILISPPVSPLIELDRPHEQRNSSSVKDVILFPDNLEDKNSDKSLFRNEEEDVIISHMSARASRKRAFTQQPLPSKDEYKLALEFKSSVYTRWAKNPKKWLEQELAYLQEGEQARGVKKPTTQQTLPRIAPASSIPKTTPKTIAKPTRTVKSIQRARVHHTPEKERTHVRNSTTTTREDRDFLALPDYSPPLSSLPSRPNSMKVEWKGTPVNLGNDQHRHLLHPDEVLLAANLRLDCATYICSKRRVFLAVLAKYRDGGDFKKTHCQQACKIDVNKASKLWQAFHQVGWFNREHFELYL